MDGALVIGGGVIGLSTAVRLLEAGIPVTVVARERGAGTTSHVAGAVFYPFDAQPRERVAGWARASYAAFRRLADDPATGVRLLDLVDVRARPEEAPWWREIPEGFHRARPDELPPGCRDGFVLRVPVVEMPVYLRWLEAQVRALGGRLEKGAVPSLARAAGRAEAVVNCAGLGARELAEDPLVRPVRGQVVRVRNPGLHRAILDERAPGAITYVIPRTRDVVLGGTSEEGATSLAPDPGAEEDILRRALALEPRLRGCEVLSRAVGLRPRRPRIRLDVSETDGRPVVHNYGHGGVGVSLSWGCAEEVVALVRDALGERASKEPLG